VNIQQFSIRDGQRLTYLSYLAIHRWMDEPSCYQKKKKNCDQVWVSS